MTNKKRIFVKDVMKSNYGTINGNATIMEALNEMKRLRIPPFSTSTKGMRMTSTVSYWCQTSRARCWPRTGQPAG